RARHVADRLGGLGDHTSGGSTATARGGALREVAAHARGARPNAVRVVLSRDRGALPAAGSALPRADRRRRARVESVDRRVDSHSVAIREQKKAPDLGSGALLALSAGFSLLADLQACSTARG